MSLPQINLVVIGHKDHGKSTLIGRLLYDSKAIPENKLREIREELKKSGRDEFEFAFILDSLEEERTGGLTIDIMQTPFKSERYQYTIIDCPGHKEFIKKMLTGASQADAAVLVVSAKEGVEDQTRQHLFLAKRLGISQLIVAVNKMDLVDYDEETFKEISGELKKLLTSLGYEGAPIIPVSAFMGENVTKRTGKMGWYRGMTLIEALDESVKPPEPPSDKPMRCLVQDVYRLGDERIVVSKVETGTLKAGSRVCIMPTGESGVVEGIESFGESKVEALPGESVGLVIDGVEDVKRGYVICYPDEPTKVAGRFTAELIVFSDIEIREGDELTIRVGTAEARCRVEKLIERINPVSLQVEEHGPGALRDGDVGRAVLQALEPICIEAYRDIPQLGRFVILGRMGAAAAGIVIEPK